MINLLAVIGVACMAAEWAYEIGTPWLFYVGMALFVPVIITARMYPND